MPAKPAKPVATIKNTFRCLAAESHIFTRAAKSAGMPLDEWIVLSLLSAAADELAPPRHLTAAISADITQAWPCEKKQSSRAA